MAARGQEAQEDEDEDEDEEPWKAPLPQFIENLYLERFGRERPQEVLSIEQVHARKVAKKARKREEKARRRAAEEGSPQQDQEPGTR